MWPDIVSIKLCRSISIDSLYMQEAQLDSSYIVRTYRVDQVYCVAIYSL